MNSFTSFDIQFNKNAFGIAIASQSGKFDYPHPGQTTKFQGQCSIDKKNLDNKPPKCPFKIQVAMRSNNPQPFFFEIPCLMHCLLSPSDKISEPDFQKFWGAIPPANEFS